MEITVPMEITKMFCVYVSVYLRHRVFWLDPLFVIIKKTESVVYHICQLRIENDQFISPCLFALDPQVITFA